MSLKKVLIISIFIIFSNTTVAITKEVKLNLQKEIKLEFVKEISGEGIAHIVVTNNSIILSDRDNICLYEFNHDGKYIKTIGMKGQGLGEYSDLSYVTNDHLGNINVCDNSNKRINIYNKDGDYIDDINKHKKMNQTKIINFFLFPSLSPWGSLQRPLFRCLL